jgi:serine protease DegS
MKPEQKVSLNIVRNRQPLTVDVVIGTRPPAETE